MVITDFDFLYSSDEQDTQPGICLYRTEQKVITDEKLKALINEFNWTGLMARSRSDRACSIGYNMQVICALRRVMIYNFATSNKRILVRVIKDLDRFIGGRAIEQKESWQRVVWYREAEIWIR